MTCRRLASLALVCAALPVAPAQADLVLNPAAVFAVGSQPMQVAQGIARQHWGADACGGQVAISWTSLAAQINATSSWTNPRSSYDNPDLNGDCAIQFNSGMDYDWGKFCTVVVHEYGHLSGKPHSPDPNDVMAPFYSAPLPECAAAPIRTRPPRRPRLSPRRRPSRPRPRPARPRSPRPRARPSPSV